MNSEMRERPFTGPGWGKPTSDPDLSVWRRFVRQAYEDAKYLAALSDKRTTCG